MDHDRKHIGILDRARIFDEDIGGPIRLGENIARVIIGSRQAGVLRADCTVEHVGG